MSTKLVLVIKLRVNPLVVVVPTVCVYGDSDIITFIFSDRFTDLSECHETM